MRVWRWGILGPAMALVPACAAVAGIDDLTLETTSGIDAGADARLPAPDAAGPDASRIDASVADAGEDASTPDAGTDDAGVDAGTDAGVDAGTDAGVDAGTDAAPPPSNIAPGGTGYSWEAMTSATANVGRRAVTAINDGDVQTQFAVAQHDDNANTFQAAGVLFPSGRTILSATYVQGSGSTQTGDGWYDKLMQLQFSTDGLTWADSGWTVNPTYAYTKSVLDQSFTFTGAVRAGVVGVRVVGEVGATPGGSYYSSYRELQITGR